MSECKPKKRGRPLSKTPGSNDVKSGSVCSQITKKGKQNYYRTSKGKRLIKKAKEKRKLARQERYKRIRRVEAKRRGAGEDILKQINEGKIKNLRELRKRLRERIKQRKVKVETKKKESVKAKVEKKETRSFSEGTKNAAKKLVSILSEFGNDKAAVIKGFEKNQETFFDVLSSLSPDIFDDRAIESFITRVRLVTKDVKLSEQSIDTLVDIRDKVKDNYEGVMYVYSVLSDNAFRHLVEDLFLPVPKKETEKAYFFELKGNEFIPGSKYGDQKRGVWLPKFLVKDNKISNPSHPIINDKIEEHLY